MEDDFSTDWVGGWCRDAAAAKLLQSCPTLCDPKDSSQPVFPIPGILQARTLEWVAISFSNAWKWKVKMKSLSRVRLFATPWTGVCQASLSMEFSRQEYWNGLPCPSPADFLDPGIKLGSPVLQAESLPTAAAAAKSLQSCPTLCDPIDSSPPGYPSLGFSRQEHWSGLPFPSAMHESEKWKWSHSAMSDSSRPHRPQRTRLLHPWDFPGKSTAVGCHYAKEGI